MNPRMTHHPHPHLLPSFSLSLLFSLCARACVANLSLSLTLSYEKKISLKKRYSRSVVRKCVYCVCIRAGKSVLTVGTTLKKQPSYELSFRPSGTKCFLTRGTDTKRFFFLAYGHTTRIKTHKTRALFVVERYFLRIFSFFVTSHVVLLEQQINNVFPESAPFLDSLSVLTHTHTYIYIVRTTTT